MSRECMTEEEIQQEIRETVLSFLRSDEGRAYIKELVKESRRRSR